MKSSIGLELLTVLVYIILCPFCFEWVNVSEIYSEGAMIFFVAVILAFITGIILFVISISLDKTVTNRLIWTISRIIIGILLFETSSLILTDSSFIYGQYNGDDSFQIALSIANSLALGIVYFANYFLVKYSKIR